MSADVDIVFRPLPAGVARRCAYRTSPFGSKWDQTWALLRREVSKLGASGAVLLVDATEHDIRLDGRLRSDTVLRTPYVELMVVGRSGPMRLPCGRYADWRSNVRAIALSLEALRAVDRHGVTRSGEQYRGWSALPAAAQPQAQDPWRNAEDAARFLLGVAGDDAGNTGNVVEVLSGQLEAVFRAAMKKAHPDAGGTNELAAQVSRARAYIEAAASASAAGSGVAA